MGKIKGQSEYKKFEEGKPLTRKEAVLAQYYICNGLDEGGEDCLGGENCPLYAYFPYRGKKIRPSQDNRSLSLEKPQNYRFQGKEMVGAGVFVS
jgi:hypothetical protein